MSGATCATFATPCYPSATLCYLLLPLASWEALFSSVRPRDDWGGQNRKIRPGGGSDRLPLATQGTLVSHSEPPRAAKSCQELPHGSPRVNQEPPRATQELPRATQESPRAVPRAAKSDPDCQNPAPAHTRSTFLQMLLLHARSRQEPPRARQEPPQSHPRAARTTQEPPRAAKTRPKSRQEPPQEPPRAAKSDPDRPKSPPRASQEIPSSETRLP